MTRRGGVAYTYSPWMRDYESGYSLHSLGSFYKINQRNAISVRSPLFRLSGDGWNREGASGIHPKEIAVEAGYAYEVIKNFSVSATFKYLFSDMGRIGNSRGASSVAFDLGVLYKCEINDWEGAGWSVGLHVSNLGPKINYLTSKDALPATVKWEVLLTCLFYKCIN
mgnify:CR=1 FL=1